MINIPYYCDAAYCSPIANENVDALSSLHKIDALPVVSGKGVASHGQEADQQRISVSLIPRGDISPFMFKKAVREVLQDGILPKNKGKFSDSSANENLYAEISQMLVCDPGVSVRYYSVFGNSIETLQHSLHANHPRETEGYDGFTSVDYDCIWPMKPVVRGFLLHDAPDFLQTRVSYKIQVLLPKWVKPLNATLGSSIRWPVYIRALALHEKGHVDIGIKHAIKIQNCIRDAAKKNPRLSLQEVRIIERRGSRISQEEHDRYDRYTQHGKTQGARL